MNDYISLLRLYLEWGIDTALSPQPTDKTKLPEPPPRSGKNAHVQMGGASPLRASTASAPMPPQDIERLAYSQTKGVTTLEQLYQVVRHFTQLGLCKTALNSVMPYGAPKAPVMIVGDAPDGEEDRSGRPFSGQNGALLDSILQFLPLERKQLILATAIPWRPPGGRSPNKIEQQICRPFITKAIALLQPTTLLLCGRIAMETVFHKRIPLPQQEWLTFACENHTTIPLMSMRHPIQLKNSAKARREIWETMMYVTDKLLNYT